MTFTHQYVPLEKKKVSHDKFIISHLYEPPQGCYAAGCRTAIFKSSGNNKWKLVFLAFSENIWFDKTSTETKIANLIFKSSDRRKPIAVWMWNGEKYELIKGKYE